MRGRSKVPDEQEELESAIRTAENLHGHFGPFLVIGVRIGRIACRDLNLNFEESKNLRVIVKTPLRTPFSCMIDGVQSTTKCTVGNRKLTVEDSEEEICVCFVLKDQSKTLEIRVSPKVTKKLMKKISEGIPIDKLGWEIASMPESRLFTVEKP
jgi:formylmethanofuran dehydrogenase subunit E